MTACMERVACSGGCCCFQMDKCMRLPYGCRITRPIHICIETERMVPYTSDSQRKSAFPFYIEKYYTKMIARAATLPLDTRNALLVARFSTSQTYKYKHTNTHTQIISVSLNFRTRCQCGGFVFNDVQYVFRSISLSLTFKKDCIVYNLFCILHSRCICVRRH